MNPHKRPPRLSGSDLLCRIVSACQRLATHPIGPSQYQRFLIPNFESMLSALL
jgi:hypothetical protein